MRGTTQQLSGFGAVGSRPWHCVVIGGGISKPEAGLELLELVTNLVHRSAPTSAIAFNTSPADSVTVAMWALEARHALA